MQNIGKDVQIGVDNYLQAWLGLVGSAVGLHLPLPVVSDGQDFRRVAMPAGDFA